MTREIFGFANPQLDVAQFRQFVERARNKMLAADTTAAAMERLERIRNTVQVGMVGNLDAMWIAGQLLPGANDEDKKAIELIFTTGAGILLGITASELKVGFEKHGMPYDSAIQESQMIYRGLSTGNPHHWLEEFFHSSVAPVAMRTMADYIDAHQAPAHWQKGWEAQQKRAPALRTMASIVEFLRAD